MHSQKYRLVKIDTERPQLVHTSILNKICYIAYLKVGERGWFLCEVVDEIELPHRIHTSEIQNIEYTCDNQVVVSTENTRYVFKVVSNEQ